LNWKESARARARARVCERTLRVFVESLTELGVLHHESQCFNVQPLLNRHLEHLGFKGQGTGYRFRCAATTTTSSSSSSSSSLHRKLCVDDSALSQTYTHKHTRMHTQTETQTLTQTQTQTQTDTQTNTHTLARTHSRTHALTHARTHARTHASERQTWAHSSCPQPNAER